MDVHEEDEDVVIKGSSLYEHLHKFGYDDFETITIEKLVPENGEKIFKLSSLVHSVKNVFRKLADLCLKIIQDDTLSKKQVESILNAKVLLNDHGCAVHNFLEKYECTAWRDMALKFIFFGTVVSSSMYISYNTQYRYSAGLLALTALCSTPYIQYLRVHAHTDLKSVVSLQNDLFDLCKKGMKILKYGYKLKLRKGKESQVFSDLTAGRLKYLQPILENLVKYLEQISYTYYHASLILVNILPASVNYDDLLTRFDKPSFEIHGEINYQKLKTLYHIYILTQSEMLNLLAIAYDSHTWRGSHRKIPELKLAHVVRFLLTHLRKHKRKLSEAIGDYYNFKLEPISYKYKGPDSSPWQDLYMHLYLASNKLQLAYSHVLSILQDIDNDVVEDVTNENWVENIAQRLNAAQKGIETAKDFVEFSSLFLVKTQTNGSTDDRLERNIQTGADNSDIRIVTDSEPEIMDEVFEEYIKEEYLKPLREEADEISLYNYKRDKTLTKNFMTELKDALVDKQKSMSEREARALQRMYKTLMKETTCDDQQQRIPTPPPMPLFNASVLTQSDNRTSNNTTKLQLNQLSAELKDTKSSDKKEKTFNGEDSGNISAEERAPIAAIPLPRNNEFSAFLPPLFLKTEEETFIGSGENSEDDEVEETKTE